MLQDVLERRGTLDYKSFEIERQKVKLFFIRSDSDGYLRQEEQNYNLYFLICLVLTLKFPRLEAGVIIFNCPFLETPTLFCTLARK
jgi:hypothetical protein